MTSEIEMPCSCGSDLCNCQHPDNMKFSEQLESSIRPDVVKKAERFATIKHLNQFRRDGVTPYIIHPARVSSLVDSDEEKAVAWLHDTLEDTETDYLELEKEFGKKITDAVVQLTINPNEDYMEFISNIKKSKNGLAKNVKIADIVSNLSDKPTEKQIKKYYRALMSLI